MKVEPIKIQIQKTLEEIRAEVFDLKMQQDKKRMPSGEGEQKQASTPTNKEAGKSQVSPGKVGRARSLSNGDKRSVSSDLDPMDNASRMSSQVDMEKKANKPSVVNDNARAADMEEASQRMSPEKQESGAKKFTQMYDKMRIEQFDCADKLSRQ